jgi:hypothetical protein
MRSPRWSAPRISRGTLASMARHTGKGGYYEEGKGLRELAAEMERNFLPWKRPEGRYPDRDGKFLILAPTQLLP